MSEYQYYEFQTIDRPLTKQKMAEVRALSTRATITPTRFVNIYGWGNFKGDPVVLMKRYYDAFLYVANWESHQLMLRLPRSVLDQETALRRRAGLQEFADDVVRSPEVRQMMARVETYHSPEIEARGSDRIRSLVEVRLKDSRVLSRLAETSRGTPERPMSRQEMAAKFADCAHATLPQERITTALDAFYRVEEMESVTELVERVTT